MGTEGKAFPLLWFYNLTTACDNFSVNGFNVHHYIYYNKSSISLSVCMSYVGIVSERRLPFIVHWSKKLPPPLRATLIFAISSLFSICWPLVIIFRLDAWALSVIATATWLAGWVARWLAGCPSHSGIVSKRLNLSENFFDHLKAPSF